MKFPTVVVCFNVFSKTLHVRPFFLLSKKGFYCFAFLIYVYRPTHAQSTSNSCQPGVFAYWDFEDCSPSSNNVTTGMLPRITNLNGCAGLTVSKLLRNHSGNSCQTRCDGSGISVCMGSSTDPAFIDNSTRAIVFSFTYPAGSVGQLSSISFQTMAPKFIDFNCSGGSTELNNNPTLWGIRVLKNNVEIFKLIDQPISLDSFTTNNIDWASNPNFAINGATTFSFEILGYKPSNVAGAGIREIWDLDELKVNGYCGTCACVAPTNVTANSNKPITIGSTINLSANSVGGTKYAWAGPNGYTSISQNPSIMAATTAMSGTYTVTVTSSGTCTATATTSINISCAISATLSQSDCNNNGTPTIKNKDNDYYDVTVSATTGSPTGNFEVLLNGTVIGSTQYNTNITISGIGSRFQADGISTYTLTIRDQSNIRCNITKTTTAVVSCSANCLPQSCPITTVIKN
jgi:hypothetical protein